MLMVLMTMAIIIVVGTSMLFVTLSSFSNSIADTQQERAYNAALTVSDTLKGSTQLNTIIETYFTKIKENGFAEVQFYNDDTDFDNHAVNYTIVNGVKVYVTLSKSPNSSKNTIDKVLVDIKGVKGSQESTVSFEADSVPDGTSTTIQDTFGSSFVVSNNMGSKVTSPYQIYKRIEGDVSINCFETENGKRVMKTRVFNPVVLEGVTGSIFANGDLIIGAPDNMLRVQGNIYCDGNLTIRGLALGVNLPALVKKYYAKKYIYYHTYAYGEIGSIAVPPNKHRETRNSSTTKLGEAMYEKLSDGKYRPIQAYDKITHYTLMDLAGEDATEYTFWTKNYGENNTTGNYTWEQVTITLRVKDKNGIWQNIDAEYNQGGINNSQYLGASMYSDTEGDGTPIMQYPEGGNIYCSGDIIFDTVNIANVYTFTPGILNTGSTESGHEDQDEEPDQSTLDKINDWFYNTFGKDFINEKIPYYSYAYNLDGSGDGTMPVHTKIEGDVYCQGRMIIAPDANESYVNFKKQEMLGITSDYSDRSKYINTSTIEHEKFFLRNRTSFFEQVKEKWEDLTEKDWGKAYNFGTVKLDVTLDRFKTHELVSGNDSLSEKPDAMLSFIEAYKKAYEEQKGANSESVQRLKEMFEKLAEGGYADFVGGDYTQFGEGKNNLTEVEVTEGNKTNTYKFRMPEFSEKSNLYIQNDPVRKGMGNTEVEKSEIYSTEDELRVVKNTDDITEAGRKVSEVDGIAYTAALTVRYCEITVNNIYCAGAISVLESKLSGYEKSAAVNVKGQYYGSDYVKNELKKVSIKELLLSAGNFNEDEVLREYFGVTENENNFKGETNLVFDVKSEDYNSQFTYEEQWTWWGFHKEKIPHYRKVFVIRAHYEMEEKVSWKNNEEHKLVYYNKWEERKKTDWYIDGKPEYSEGRFVADLVYCFEDYTDYTDHNYSNDQNNATDKIVTSDGTIYEHEKWGDLDLKANERALVDYLYSTKDLKDNEAQYKYALSLAQKAFINFEATPAGYKNFKEYFIKNKTNGFNTATNDPRSMPNQSEIDYVKAPKQTYWGISYEHPTWKISASRTVTAKYKFELKPFKEIVGVKELEDDKKPNDKLSYELPKEYILDSKFLNKKELIAMFSNGSNDFGGINNGLIDKDRPAIIGGKYIPATDNAAVSVFEAIIRGVFAFDHKNSIYGMYLVKDKKYANVDKDAYVKAIFEEITSSEFATVVEANTDKDESQKNIKKILENLKKEGQLNEYNTFDIYGSVNEYDKILGKTGKNVTDYKCQNGENDRLTKKYIRSKGGVDSNPLNYESWFITNTLNNNDSWFNIKRLYYIKGSNNIEDDSSLRLMDFYKKDDENSAHLRADSTFAIDEKYNQTFTTFKNMKIDWSNFSIAVRRSEVQYTIKQNTYFNFEESNTQVVFAASTDGVDARTRMNFLIDTSEKDIYVFFHCKALDKSKDKSEQTRFLFQKCSFQVTGKNNAYLMLVDDTSFAANAYSLEISNTMLSEDKTDEKVGTHFKSNTYQKYVARFKEDRNRSVKVVDLFDAMQMKALPDGNPTNVGYMFIIGMGRNYVKFGRGGSVNALVYIPHGMYSNESSGILNFIPIANSGNNEASIVAKDIYIGGSNRGQLIFSSYDVSQTGSKNNNSAGITMDGLINTDTVNHGTKWVAGDYYYG